MVVANSSVGSLRAPTDLISVGEVCRLLGAHANSVRRWTTEGSLVGYRTAGGHRRYSRSEVLAQLGDEEELKRDNVVIVYGRVSTAKQRDDLARQMVRLREYAQSNFKGRAVVELEDLGSGMNLERKGLTNLLNGILSGRYDGATLIVEHRDRLARWSAPLIELICTHHKVDICYVEQQECSDEEMLAADLMAIIHIFSCKSYSRRSSMTQGIKLAPAVVERTKELLDQGWTPRAVAEVLKEEGLKDEAGNEITYSTVYRKVKLALSKLEKVIPSKGKDSGLVYVEQFIVEAADNIRTPQKVLYAHYKQWATEKRLLVVTPRKLFQGLRRFEQSLNRYQRCFVGLKVKGHDEFSFSAVRIELESTPLDHLVSFLKSLGSWSGFFVEFRARYEEFCQKASCEPISRGHLVRALESLGAKLIRKHHKNFHISL